MAQSTLNLTTDELRKTVIRFCGMSTSVYASLSATEAADVDRYVRAGLRRFYAPPPLPGERSSHQWSFLSPRGSITTVVDQVAYDLPDTFGGILEGGLNWPSDYPNYRPIPIVSDSVFRHAMQGDSASGIPRMATILPKADVADVAADGTPDIPTAFEILLFPPPDTDDIELSFRYYVIQDDAAGLTNIPGGALHADTIIASCRYSASELAEPRVVEEHRKMFMERLAASVSVDRRQTSQTALGYNGDNSDGRSVMRPLPTTTVNGVQY